MSFPASLAHISLSSTISSAFTTPGKFINSPRPRILSRRMGSAISGALMTAPACSKGVAGTQEGSMNSTSRAVFSAACII